MDSKTMNTNDFILKSKLDNSQHIVNKKLMIKHSELFRDMLQDDDSNIVDVELTNEQLQHTIQFISYHNDEHPFKAIPKPLPSKHLQQYVDQWDFNFVSQKSENQLLNIIKAANQINCKDLLDLCLAYIAASKFIGMTIDELRKEYEINEELTQELDEKIKKKYEYIFKDTKFTNHN